MNEAKICYKKWVFNFYHSCVSVSFSMHMLSPFVISYLAYISTKKVCMLFNQKLGQTSKEHVRTETNERHKYDKTHLLFQIVASSAPVPDSYSTESYSRRYLNDIFMTFFCFNCSRNFYLPSWVLPIHFCFNIQVVQRPSHKFRSYLYLYTYSAARVLVPSYHVPGEWSTYI